MIACELLDQTSKSSKEYGQEIHYHCLPIFLLALVWQLGNEWLIFAGGQIGP